MGAPVIICGATEQIGQGVIAGLKPEYDESTEAGVSQIPAILRGDASVPSDSSLGTKVYTKPPGAVLLGARFDDDDINKTMEASKNTKMIPWLRPDLTKPTPPLGPEYGKALVARIKALLEELATDGKMIEEKVHWY
ncbi:hypothetical protein F5Y16DRAFT_406256 [Xylariaceae sp. FL0255]|nr:hypothetical protein F5Y16DRAFT_406256 [Xylariaceae sp. FL0255]